MAQNADPVAGTQHRRHLARTPGHAYLAFRNRILGPSIGDPPRLVALTVGGLRSLCDLY